MNRAYTVHHPANEHHPEHTRVVFTCPGCGFDHGVTVTPGTPYPAWEWNGSLEAPTLRPSVLCTYPWGPGREQRTCHSFVTEGRIQYLGDCSHGLAGQTIDLPGQE